VQSVSDLAKMKTMTYNLKRQKQQDIIRSVVLVMQECIPPKWGKVCLAAAPTAVKMITYQLSRAE